MQERGSALAICMRLSPKPSQVPAQLIVQALNVMGMSLAYGVLLSLDDGFIRPMSIRTVMDMRISR